MAIQIDLKGKVALVTGVGSGIGQGIAKVLAQAGCKIAGIDKLKPDDAGVVQFNQFMSEAGTEALYIQSDVTKETDTTSLIKSVGERFFKIDILVSNAGRNIFEGAAICDEEHWNENINLNLAAHWRISKLAKPYLEATGNGIIIIITSNHAYSTIPGCFPYNVAKTALTGLVRSLAIEWGPTIRVVGLAPGFIQTPGNDQWFDSFSDPAAERKRTIDLHPVKKLGTVEEIGAYCAFLSSDWVQFSSGSTYLIDGGRSAILQDT